MIKNLIQKNKTLFCLLLGSLILPGCASVPEMKTQAYAKLQQDRVYEYDLPVVWKAIEEVFRNYKITRRDPKEVSPTEFPRLTERSLQTDWIYGQSRDKYQEYEINGSPRKTYLQTRLRYEIEVKKQMGGTHVQVKTDEEIEKLKSDGSSDGYSSVDNPDSSRGNEILEKIKFAILALPGKN